MDVVSNSRAWWVFYLMLNALCFCSLASGRIIYVEDSAVGANDGSSWVDAFPCLQNALTITQYGDEIHVAQGIYQPDRQLTVRNRQIVTSGDRTASFVLKSGVTLIGGYAGLGEPVPNMRDIDLYKTILSGDLKGNDGPDFRNNSENSYNILTSNETNATSILDGFTITGGNANGSREPWYWGGGIYNNGGDLTLINCTFFGNSAKKGGGMHNTSSDPTLINCKFIDNSSNDDAGGIWNDQSSPILTNCIFMGNYSGNFGGGIRNKRASSPILSNCIFSANSAENKGGGMDNSNGDPGDFPSNAILTDCLFLGNWAPEGGGMSNQVSHPILTNCTFVGNLAEIGVAISCIRGGDADIGFGSHAQLINCIVWDGDNGIWISENSTIMITYSDIKGGWPGEGNINADPMFVNTANGDCHLRDGSPCIDAGIMIEGVPGTDIEGNPRPNPQGSRPDMGAYEHGPKSWWLKAKNPNPADGISTKQKYPVLSWTPGEKAVEHDVYLGTGFEDVNNADIFDISGIYRGRWIDPNYVAEELDLDQTYYWRVDEINDLEQDSPWKGNVWCFTVTEKATVEFQVPSGDDDVYATDSSLLNFDANFLKIGSSSFAMPPYYMSGMVFRDINIPRGIELVEAHLKIRSYDSRLTGNVYGKIEAEATDNANAFGESRHVGSLPTTEASVDWNHEEPWIEDTWYDSPDIAAVIQEVIDREGWSPGNSLAILYSTWSEGDYRNFSSYDRGSDYAPKLVITYVPE